MEIRRKTRNNLSDFCTCFRAILVIRLTRELITLTKLCKLSTYTSVLVPRRYFKMIDFSERIFRSANADIVSLFVEYKSIAAFWQNDANSPANSRPLSTHILSGFTGTAVVHLVARQKSGCILGDSSLMSEIISFNAFLYGSAVLRLIGRTRRNRLSVSTATKKFTPLFGRAAYQPSRPTKSH